MTFLLRVMDRLRLRSLSRRNRRAETRLSLEHLEDRIMPSTLAVLDDKTNTILPSNGTPINSFSNWSMSLQAQVAGVAVTSYTWTLGSDATSISGSSTYNVQFAWASFTGAPRTDTISVTATYSGGSLTQSFTFQVTATSSPAWSSAPTSSSTWPSVIAPDQLKGQSSAPAGPYASVGLADGSVQTSFSLPSYNPNVAPLGLVYNSAVADPQPIFQVRYQLDPSQSLPSSVTAQLTLTDQSNNTVFTGSTIYYNPSSLNPGDWMLIALQANCSGLASGRYNWQINLTANYATPASPSYSGAFNLITGSTTPTSNTTSPFGLGWSLAGVERLIPVTGGAIVQNPDGTSLWFATSGSGTFTTPAGEYSTLTQNTGTGVYTWTLLGGFKFTFNSTGRETAAADLHGNTTTLAYNSAAELTTVTDMNGQVNTISYGSLNHLATSITDPASRQLLLGQNGSNQLTSITDPSSSVWTYSYSTSNDLTSLIDPGVSGTHFTTSFSYTFARATGATPPAGGTISDTFMQENGLPASGTGTSGSPATAVLLASAQASFTDGGGNQAKSFLDGLGFGTSVQSIDPLGNTTLCDVDANGLAWLCADPLGRRTRYFFNSNGLPTATIFADDYASGGGDPGTSASYNSLGEITQFTNALGNVFTYAYSTSGDLTSFTNPLGGVWSYAYNSAGLVTSATSPLGTTTFSYDSYLRLTGETDPLGTQGWSYNSSGFLSTYTNQNGGHTTYQYTTAGLVSIATDPLGHATGYAYASNGWLTSMTLVTHTISFSYNGMGQVTQQSGAFGSTSYSFNNAGLVTSISGYNNGLGAFTYGYDADGRQTSVTGQGGTTSYAFDAAGNLTQSINPLGFATTNSYDSRNNLLSVTDPLGTTSYTYNYNGWRLSETDPLSNVTSYAFNALGLVTSMTNANGYTASYSYNTAGLETASTDFAGNSLAYTFNGLGEKTGASGTGYTATFSYDAMGNMTYAADGASVYTYSYGSTGLLTQTQISYPGSGLATVTLSYGYDSYGNRTSMSDSLSGNISYGYTAANLLSNMYMGASGAALAMTFTYDTSNRLSTTTYNATGGHNFSTTYSWDSTNHLTGITYRDTSAGTNLATFSYGYNAASAITSYTDPDGSLTYGYDNGGQLTSVNGAHSETFGYDANGNRNTTGYTVGTGNQITTDPAGNTFSYLGGNLGTKTDSSGNVWTYTFDVFNRLTQVVEKNSGGTTLFTENLYYDVFTNLIGVKVNGIQQRWTVFDGSNPYIDFNGSGTLTQRYLMNPNALDQFFAIVGSSGSVSWLLTDNLGSIREVVSSTGTNLDAITYGAFGNILSQTNSANAPRFLYAGGEWDSNLGLYHYGARWDDPANGRWISQDPLGLGPDTNPYRYVNNAATNATDPTGKFFVIPFMIVGGIIGGIFADGAGQAHAPDVGQQIHPRPDGTMVGIGRGMFAGYALGSAADFLAGLIGEVPPPQFDHPDWNQGGFQPPQQIPVWRLPQPDPGGPVFPFAPHPAQGMAPPWQGGNNWVIPGGPRPMGPVFVPGQPAAWPLIGPGIVGPLFNDPPMFPPRFPPFPGAQPPIPGPGWFNLN